MVILLMLMIHLSRKKRMTIPSSQQQREPGPREKRPWDFRIMALALFPPLEGLWNPEHVMDLCMPVC